VSVSFSKLKKIRHKNLVGLAVSFQLESWRFAILFHRIGVRDQTNFRSHKQTMS
jgi:hypothetical protein